MPWRRSRDEPTPVAEEGPAGLDPASDAALDLVGDILRGLGEHVVELGDLDADAIRSRFEEWARHLLVGAPAPEHSETGAAVPLAQRDWAGARRFTLDQHHREFLQVRRSIGDLRDAIWAFIHGLGEALVDDRANDVLLREQMDRVRRAVDSPSTEEIRREAIAAVGVMGRALADRNRQQRRHFESLGERVRELRTELETARAEMERDGLTQLYNRAALDEHLRRVVDLGNAFGHPACLYLVDVDHFKWVNDTFGHPVGDEVLRQMGAALERELRRSEDFAGRYGGDEMVVVVSEDTADRALALGERLAEIVRGLDIQGGGETVRVTASIGVALLAPGEDVVGWVERADRALYDAKQAGRDRVRLAEAPSRSRRQESEPEGKAPAAEREGSLR